MARFTIASNQRAVCIGKTNSGKSYLSRYLVYPFPRLIVCDSKDEIDLDEWNLQEYTDRRFKQLVRNPAAGTGPKDQPIRLRLRVKHESEWSGHLSDFLKARNVFVQIDELIQLGDAARGPELRALFTRGRSRGLGVLACTQRPSGIPLASLTEAETYIIFQTKHDDDNDRIFQFIGKRGMQELHRWGYEDFSELRERQFLWYSDLTTDAQLYNMANITTNGRHAK